MLFSLGSTSAVANVVAGIVLTYMRPFQIGNRVKIADTFGDVVEETLLVTRVRTIKNVVITISNSMVLGSHIINFSASAKDRDSSSIRAPPSGTTRPGGRCPGRPLFTHGSVRP